jgi:hypothetical protein
MPTEMVCLFARRLLGGPQSPHRNKFLNVERFSDVRQPLTKIGEHFWEEGKVEKLCGSGTHA